MPCAWVEALHPEQIILYPMTKTTALFFNTLGISSRAVVTLTDVLEQAARLNNPSGKAYASPAIGIINSHFERIHVTSRDTP